MEERIIVIMSLQSHHRSFGHAIPIFTAASSRFQIPRYHRDFGHAIPIFTAASSRFHRISNLHITLIGEKLRRMVQIDSTVRNIFEENDAKWHFRKNWGTESGKSTRIRDNRACGSSCFTDRAYTQR